MTAPFLDRIVESGTISLRDVRRSIGGAARRGIEQMESSAPPFISGDGAGDAGPVASPWRRDLRLDQPGDPSSPPLEGPRPVEGPPESRAITADPTLADAPAASRARRATDVADRGSRDPAAPAAGEAHGSPHWSRAAAGPAARPSLKDAGIRSVSGPVTDARRPILSQDGNSGASGSDRENPAAAAQIAEPMNRHSVDGRADGHRRPPAADASPAVDRERTHPQAMVPAERLEQWQRLRDRLLVEHYRGAAVGEQPPAAAGRNASAAQARTEPAPPALVIEQLEVVVAAPDAAPAPPSRATAARPARTGAWSVAARHYLGKL